MLKTRNIIIDTHSLVYDLLKPYAVDEFWDFSVVEPRANTVYIVGRQQVVENLSKLKEWSQRPELSVVFDGSAEGSWTLVEQSRVLGLTELIKQGKLLLLSGGDLESDYHYLLHEHFINVFLGYEQNLAQMQRWEEIYTAKDKPYKFLFLNGRARPHRKYIWERLRQENILEQSIWTMLDPRPGRHHNFVLWEADINLMSRPNPIRRLDPKYEVPAYRDVKVNIDAPTRQFIKHEMFENTWGEVYLQAEPYIDSYFSLVTETVVEYSGSFRTEKIVKPIAQAHPWICAANPGFYRDIRNLGFQTFNSLLDESFDQIDHAQDRMERIVQVVKDLCSQDLNSFLASAKNICKYNQQHLREYREQYRRDFPDRFFNFINSHQ
jgi:hypothetical protein